MTNPNRSAPYTLGPWPKGINNVKRVSTLDLDELRDARDFIFDEKGFGKTRPELSLDLSGTAMSGLFSVNSAEGLVFDAGTLYRVNPRSGLKIALASGYSSGLFTSYVEVGPEVFFTNGREYGRVNVVDWAVRDGFGTPNPDGLAVSLASAGFGTLPAGTYLVGLAFVDTLGEESGCQEVLSITLPSSGGITVSWAGTVPSGVGSIRIYASSTNGTREELDKFDEVPVSTSSIVIDGLFRGAALGTLFLEPVPVPDLVTLYNGRLYFAVDNKVFSTEPFRYGLYNEDNNEVGVFPEKVSVLEANVNGIFVVADRTYSYVGSGPKDFELNDSVFDFPASFGSGTQVEGKLFDGMGLQLSESAPYWFSSRGGVLGLPNGSVLALSRGRAEPKRFARGVSGMVEFEGAVGIVAGLQDETGPADSLAISDNFSVRVVKHGLSEE